MQIRIIKRQRKAIVLETKKAWIWIGLNGIDWVIK